MLHAKARYEGGLGQLDSTQHQVTEMQNTLKLLQPKLIAATQDIQRMVANIEKESQEVAEFEKVVKVDEAAAEVSFIQSLLIYYILCCYDNIVIILNVKCKFNKIVLLHKIIIVQIVANEADVIRAECDADLAEAMPILNRAQQALDTLTLADIAIVKAMKHPPYSVKLIVESVCVLKVQKQSGNEKCIYYHS